MFLLGETWQPNINTLTGTKHRDGTDSQSQLERTATATHPDCRHVCWDKEQWHSPARYSNLAQECWEC